MKHNKVVKSRQKCMDECAKQDAACVTEPPHWFDCEAKLEMCRSECDLDHSP